MKCPPTHRYGDDKYAHTGDMCTCTCYYILEHPYLFKLEIAEGGLTITADTMSRFHRRYIWR